MKTSKDNLDLTIIKSLSVVEKMLDRINSIEPVVCNVIDSTISDIIYREHHWDGIYDLYRKGTKIWHKNWPSSNYYYINSIIGTSSSQNECFISNILNINNATIGFAFCADWKTRKDNVKKIALNNNGNFDYKKQMQKFYDEKNLFAYDFHLLDWGDIYVPFHFDVNKIIEEYPDISQSITVPIKNALDIIFKYNDKIFQPFIKSIFKKR